VELDTVNAELDALKRQLAVEQERNLGHSKELVNLCEKHEQAMIRLREELSSALEAAKDG
jgi:hypothetical protein